MIASSRSLVIFANAPEKGRVKSRIAADLGPDVALTAYKTLAEHAVAAASHVDWCRKTIAYAPNGTGEAMRDWFGDLFDYRAQGDGDLGRRMIAALERAFADGADRVVLIGVDCPGVTDAVITEAFARLDAADAVLGQRLVRGERDIRPEIGGDPGLHAPLFGRVGEDDERTG